MNIGKHQVGDQRQTPGPVNGHARRLHLAVLPLLGIAIASAALALLHPTAFDRTPARDLTAIDAGDGPLSSVRLASMNVDDKAQIVVQGNDALARNAALPFANGPLGLAEPFRIGDESQANARTALKCMTQAIYYEAGFEPVQGRRAVAQVILNRMRHPAYPHSVCGVVYQGSHRRTGCQFSFTCDGSLLRAPAAGAWRDAEEIAREALSGTVEKSVGTSTHYHADYVLPKWAYSLGKLRTIGRHIFYRFNGGAGRSNAFSARYAGNEHIPTIDFAMLQSRLSEEGDGLAEAAYSPGLTVTPHVTDRHAVNDVGGRIDTRKQWRLSIPDPVGASKGLREAIDASNVTAGASERVAVSMPPGTAENP